jgi:hypothetical protein
MKLRSAAAFLLKRTVVLFASAVFSCLLILILLEHTKIAGHRSWLFALFISAVIGGVVLGLAERHLQEISMITIKVAHPTYPDATAEAVKCLNQAGVKIQVDGDRISFPIPTKFEIGRSALGSAGFSVSN